MKRTSKLLLFILTISLFVCLTVFAASAQTYSGKSGLPEIHITLADGLDLNTVNSGSKETKYLNNTVTLIDSTGGKNTYENVEFKGRGNYTWNVSRMVKKPYQIKFSEKVKVFGLDKAKKWVLLANYADASLMRNKLIFDTAKQIGLSAPESMWTDVFVNDEYIGNYLLCEKNEVGKGRVELSDQYGVLCEIDGNYGTSEEVYFKTDIEKTVVVLIDSVADDVGKENSVSEKAFELFRQKLNKFEALLYSDNATFDEIAELIDVDSFIKYYYINELAEDPDGLRSSFYLYCDGENDVIHLGPVWDYDSALGAYTKENLGGNTNADYSVNIKKYMGSSSVGWFRKLFSFNEYAVLSKDIYNEEIKPVFEKLPEAIDNYIKQNGEKTAFYKSAENNFVRWGDLLGTESVFGAAGHKYGKTFESEVNYLKSWISGRVNYLNERYSELFQVGPDTDDNKTECSCNCHKSGFMGFIWKIQRFFYKLFGTHKTCSCGVKHY